MFEYTLDDGRCPRDMKMTGEQLHFATADEGRAWLEANHAGEDDAWLLISKKHAKTPSVGCMRRCKRRSVSAWIDSSMQPIDGERYALRFTPRRKTSKWSERN